MSAEFLASPALPDVRHGFFTRRGGVSTGPFESLNCSLSGADDRQHVLENRARAALALGAEPGHLVGCTQVHGIEVAVVEDAWPPSAGPRADAMVTARPGLALGIITADCAPVLLAGATASGAAVVGAVHAGWRGAVAGVLEATVAAMARLGARRIAAAVGPCIRQPSYEVGADLRDAVLARDAGDAGFFAPGQPGHWQFDLAGYCAARLRGIAAVDIGAVDVVPADTLPDSDRFFSHRRRTLAGGGPIGHQISIVAP